LAKVNRTTRRKTMVVKKRFTSGQERQFGKLAQDAFASFNFNIEDAQRVLSNKKASSRLKQLVSELLVQGSALATGLVPAGWTVATTDGVIQDVAASQFDVAKLRPRAFHKAEESYVAGDEMRLRAVKAKANWGLADGQRILAEQDKLSAEFRGFYIPLAGTVLCGSDGGRHVACLSWLGGRWVLYFHWLGLDWFDSGRFACRE